MTTSVHRLCFLLTISYFLVGRCNGSDDAASFRGPPPPPPPRSSSYSTPITTDYRVEDDYPRGEQQQGMSPPPPPPPPSQEKYDPDSRQQMPQQQGSQEDRSMSKGPSLPIHYEFPMADDDFRDEGGRRRPSDREDFDDDNGRDVSSATSSARRDLVTQYWSTKVGKAQIQTVIGLVGYGSGSFVAKVRSIWINVCCSFISGSDAHIDSVGFHAFENTVEMKVNHGGF